jgi:hypothetical protein
MHFKQSNLYKMTIYVINYSFLLILKCNKLESEWELQQFNFLAKNGY